MSLSNKIALYLLLLGACLALGTYAAISFTIFPAFEEFEADSAIDAVTRVERGIDAEKLALDTMLIEYAQWNDTYDFVLGDEPEYVAENLEDIAYWRSLGVDYLLILDIEGRLLWSTDMQGEEISPIDTTALLGGPLDLSHPLLTARPGANLNSSLIPSSAGTLLVAAAPILKSFGNGPAVGYFVLARRVDSELMANVAQRAQVDGVLYEIGEEAVPGHADAELRDMATGGRLRHVHRRGDSVIGHHIFLGLDGQPIALSEVRLPPQITAVGGKAIMAAMTLICIVAALFLAIALVVLKYTVLRPVNELSQSMQRIRESGDLDVQIRQARGDEIGALAKEFDALTTDLHLAQRELVATRDVAVEASRAKSEFLARMSHEIRTPMNGVLGMTELLRNTALDFDQRRFADTIYASAEGLLNIINDILDFSKIEAGKLELEQRDIDLGAVIEDTVDSLAAQAHKKGLELINDVAPAVHSPVVGDPMRLRQVLTNLVANAIKFTDRGEVVVCARAGEASEEYVEMHIEVVDTGIGIRHEKQDSIFDSFAQEDGSTTRMYGGTGLGLAICRQLVELMGGDLAVDSTPGFGSRFHFDLRLQRSSKTPSPGSASPRSVAGKRVLVVDDNKTNREILERQFAGWRARCDSACDADQAMECIDRSLGLGKPYDLLILDMHMPRIDGVELARRIRARDGGADVPILLLSSVATPATEGVLQTLRIAGQLTKPIRQGQLYDSLNAVLSGGGFEERYRRPGRDSIRALDGRVLLAEDNPVNQAVALGMLDSLGVDVTVVADGEAAVRATGEQQFDLVLMDCQMPVLDGLAATRRIRKREATENRSRLPIIAVTANAMTGDRERCLEAGMDDYLAKPFTTDQLHAALSVHLLPGSAASGMQAAAVAAGVEADPGEPLDRSVLDALAQLGRPDSPCLVTRVAGIYLDDSGEILERLLAALHDGDAAAAREAAHALKSSSMNVGATRLADLCKNMEAMARRNELSAGSMLASPVRKEHERVIEALRGEIEAVTR